MTKHRPLVLLVEDDPSMARIAQAYMGEEPVELETASTGNDALTALTRRTPDVVLLDLKLPDMDGFDILRAVTDRGLPTEVVIVTGQGSLTVAVEAMRLGARDFLVKPFAKERLLTTLRNSLDRRRLVETVETYRDEIDRHDYLGFVGSSLAMQRVYRIIDSAADSKASVFITGESGTGKEVCAEAIHQRSPRAERPFVAVNCGAIPRDLMESELFGHVRGAFTGAERDRDGAALRADGGTLFLDEVCELGLDLQPKLLRFLQTGEVQRVGEGRARAVDARILCATNRDPLAEVRAGRFREDLYYRLHVVPLDLPPLRDRDDDVLAIARHFLDRYGREEGKTFSGFSEDAAAIVATYAWPGNVRQLQNVVRRIVVLNPGGEVGLDQLPDPLDAPMQDDAPPPTAEPVHDPRAAIRPLAELERDAIERAIELCGGRVPDAAHYLGISAATIYRKRAAWSRESG